MMREGNNISLPRLAGQLTIPMERASFGQRFLAFLIDSIILGIIDGCINFIGVPNWFLFAGQPAQEWLSVAIVIIQGLIPTLYFIWAYSTTGQTLGKRALKIRVSSMDGSPLNLGKGILRSLGYIPSTLVFYIGYLSSIWDIEKQAWHDKLAGTCVVPVSFQNSINALDPVEVRRIQKRWILGLGVLTAFLFLTGYILTSYFVERNLAEVRTMGPWPGAWISPEALVAVDLSDYGLVAGQVQDARDEETWANANYSDGAVVIYGSGNQPVVGVWAMKYLDRTSARSDYMSLLASVKEAGACGRYIYAYDRGSGLVHCQFTNLYQKLFWNDVWIVNIVALEGSNVTPEVLVDQVRDVISANWSAISQP